MSGGKLKSKYSRKPTTGIYKQLNSQRIILGSNLFPRIWASFKFHFTHLPLVLHICVSESDQPIQRQDIIYTNARIWSITLLGTNLSDILTKIQKFSFTTMHLKISTAKVWPFCPGGDELKNEKLVSTMFLSQGQPNVHGNGSYDLSVITTLLWISALCTWTIFRCGLDHTCIWTGIWFLYTYFVI